MSRDYSLSLRYPLEVLQGCISPVFFGFFERSEGKVLGKRLCWVVHGRSDNVQLPFLAIDLSCPIVCFFGCLTEMGRMFLLPQIDVGHLVYQCLTQPSSLHAVDAARRDQYDISVTSRVGIPIPERPGL